MFIVDDNAYSSKKSSRRVVYNILRPGGFELDKQLNISISFISTMGLLSKIIPAPPNGFGIPSIILFSYIINLFI